MVVGYEDLSQNSEQIVGQILQFLASRAMLRRMFCDCPQPISFVGTGLWFTTSWHTPANAGAFTFCLTPLEREHENIT